MWGAKLNGIRTVWSKAMDNLLFAGKTPGVKGDDQNALAKYVWSLTGAEGI